MYDLIEERFLETLEEIQWCECFVNILGSMGIVLDQDLFDQDPPVSYLDDALYSITTTFAGDDPDSYSS